MEGRCAVLLVVSCRAKTGWWGHEGKRNFTAILSVYKEFMEGCDVVLLVGDW